MTKDEITKINDDLQLKVNTEVEKRVREWLVATRGVDWTEKFELLVLKNIQLQDKCRILREALNECGQKLGELAQVYINAGRPNDHDCALELQSALKHWVIKPAHDKIEELLKGASDGHETKTS